MIEFSEQEKIVNRKGHGTIGKAALAKWDHDKERYWRFCTNGSGHDAAELRQIADELDRLNAPKSKPQGDEVRGYD